MTLNAPSRWPEPGCSSRRARPDGRPAQGDQAFRPAPEERAAPSLARPRSRRKRKAMPAEIVGPEDRGRRPHRRPGREQRRQEARPDRPVAACTRASSTAARCATRPGSRPPSTSSSRPLACRRNGVRLGLANTRIGVRTIEITGVTDGQQLENAVSFRAHELLSDPARRSRPRFPGARDEPERRRQTPCTACCS